MSAATVPARRARPVDRNVVVEILVSAFYADPTRSWAFPDPARRAEQQRRLWGLFVDGAMRYPEVWLTADNTATAVWIPPGGTDLSDEQEPELERMLVELLGPDAGRVLDAFELFEQAHPRAEPHFYLGFLGTEGGSRGHGYGLGLLADNLRRIDPTGMPAYLEASNPVNVALYARYGFVPRDTFRPGPGAPDVTTMWREPGGR